MDTRPLRERRSARLLVINPAGEVLLFKFLTKLLPPRMHAKGIMHFWATPGGALAPGESFEDAAARELFEETGWRAPRLSPSVMDREFKMQIENEWVWVIEKYYLMPAPPQELRTDGFTALERETMTEHAWWSVKALEAASDPVFPEGLGGLIARLGVPEAF